MFFFDGEGMCWFPGGSMQTPGERDVEKQALLTSPKITPTHRTPLWDMLLLKSPQT